MEIPPPRQVATVVMPSDLMRLRCLVKVLLAPPAQQQQEGPALAGEGPHHQAEGRCEEDEGSSRLRAAVQTAAEGMERPFTVAGVDAVHDAVFGNKASSLLKVDFDF